MRTTSAVAALVIIATLLTSARDVHDLPASLLAVLSAFVVLAAWRPVAALTTLAAVLPVAQWCGRWWNGGIVWPDMLVLAFALGYTGRRALHRNTPALPDRTLDAAVATMAAVVVASWVVDVWVNVELDSTMTLTGWVRSFREHALTGGGSPATGVALVLLQGLFLFAAASRCTRESPTFRQFLPRSIAAGAAVAAALNVARLFEAAWMHPDYWRVFFRHLASTRLNVHYGDVNAAGSYFVMTLFVVVALTLAARGRWRTAWMLAAVLSGLGLWVSGSRAAIVAGLGVVLVLSVAAAASRRPLTGKANVRLGTTMTLLTLVLAVLVGLSSYLPLRGSQPPSLLALRIRLEFARTSLRMAAHRPVFGIGLARYHARSGEFSSPELLTLFPSARNENAHNNLLQILAELGLVGLSSLVWILWLSARRLSALATASPEPLAWGMMGGLAAFAITWLGGHPLLTREPAYTFFLLIGGAAGWGAAVSLPKAPPLAIASFVLASAIALLALTLPLHIRQYMADANLEHVGIAMSPWQTAGDGTRYRWCGKTCTVFIPADARAVSFGLRGTATQVTVRVALRLDGRPVNELNIDADRWTTVSLTVPPSSGTRFRRLELAVVSGAAMGNHPVLMVGKVHPR